MQVRLMVDITRSFQVLENVNQILKNLVILLYFFAFPFLFKISFQNVDPV